MSWLAIDGALPERDVDGELLEGLRRGDSAAAEHLVARYADGAYRVATGIVGNAAEAEAVVEDAFSSAIESVDTFRGDAAFGSWLYGIVAGAAFRRVGQDGRGARDIVLDDVLPSFHEDTEHPEAIDDWSGRLDDPRIDVRSAMGSAADGLSPEHRAVVFLHDVEELPIANVASALGISVVDAKTRLHHARLVLRKGLTAFLTTPGV